MKRQPVASVDFDPDKPMEGDDYAWFTSTGQYEGAGWAEWKESETTMANLREALDISDYETAEGNNGSGLTYTVLTYTVKHDDNPGWALSIRDGAMPPHICHDYASLEALIAANPEVGDMEWTAIGEDGEPIEK